MHAELCVQRLRVIADHFESATFCGAFGAERTDQYVPPRPDRFGDLTDVSCTLVGRSQKMKHCPVVPHIIGVG